MAFRVEGKIALITGAASGIGFEYASELLRHGLKGVTIVDFDSTKGNEAAQKLNTLHGKKVAIFSRADVTKESEIKGAFEAAMAHWKSLDIVINNAGVMKDGSWKMEVAVNCNAVVTGSLLALEHMGKNNGGNGGIVVNIASILGLQELSGCPIYVGTKHFVLGLTRSFGQPYFYNKTGVTFLTMCPGVTNTPLISDASGFALDYPGLGNLLAEQLGALPEQESYSFRKGGKKTPGKSKDPCAPKKPEPLKCPPPCPCTSKPASAKPIVCPPPKPPACPPPKPPVCPPPKPPCPCPCPCCTPKPIMSPAVEGKVAVITGASVGIGYYIAKAILKNGGKVMLGDVKVEEGKEAICKIIDEFGMDKAAFIKCDVTKPKDMECLFNAALCEFKQIDIVVNNAGILEDQLWDKTIDINVKGVIRGTLMGFHYMRKNKCGGRIINLASILGHQPCYACPVYCGTKHFVIGFSRSIGSDFYFCQSGVKVMTLCPGVTLSAMVVESESRPQLEGFGDTSKALHEELYKMPTQPVEVCGMHIVPILEADINGSDWISEGSEVYRLNRADRFALRVPG